MAAAVVTGAASGIGRAIATALIAEGWHVLLTDIHTERLQKTVADLGDNAIGLQGDIAAPDMAKTLADKAFSAFGAVDMVFANAGLGINAPLLDATPDQFDLASIRKPLGSQFRPLPVTGSKMVLWAKFALRDQNTVWASNTPETGSTRPQSTPFWALPMSSAMNYLRELASASFAPVL